MEKLAEILKDLEQGKISADNAEGQVLRLFNVSGQSEQLICPFCQSDDLFEFELKHSKCRKCKEQWTN